MKPKSNIKFSIVPRNLNSSGANHGGTTQDCLGGLASDVPFQLIWSGYFSLLLFIMTSCCLLPVFTQTHKVYLWNSRKWQSFKLKITMKNSENTRKLKIGGFRALHS